MLGHIRYGNLYHVLHIKPPYLATKATTSSEISLIRHSCSETTCREPDVHAIHRRQHDRTYHIEALWRLTMLKLHNEVSKILRWNSGIFSKSDGLLGYRSCLTTQPPLRMAYILPISDLSEVSW